ncbi:ATP-binding protein [Mycolicibacterium tokaiense]|uniref:ATP-binding protein n=1 Tax=Mycolicibacterium tokaiense TaxID=39695 RepID=UPI00138DA23F|nr:adenylate/guanylate cyclase domain-containing protein [Mycolicibacterium tokaiense]BBY87506.1 adenylate cyclase [Mycolicibacterium tokaiense]
MTQPDSPSRIDELLDQAFRAIELGDRRTAVHLAARVLALDEGNLEAEDLLAAPTDQGEIRRLTIMFADLVDSTALSTRVEPEVYRTVVGRYRDDVIRIVRRYEGHIGSTKGDGLLAFFGHPHAHEDDVRRAVQAGLDITREVAALSARVQRRFGFDIDVRVGIHRGIVYLDTHQDDVFGLAANLAARVCSLAEPGSVAVSEAIEPLVRGVFELHAQAPRAVKGVADPLRCFRVIGERDVPAVAFGPLIGRRREFESLRAAWESATRGDLEVPGAAIIGDAGIGKSRLAWSVIDLARRSHSAVLQLIGSPFHPEIGLRPVRRLIERQCHIGRDSDPAERLRLLRQELAVRGIDAEATVPLLAPVLGIDPHAGYRPAQAEGPRLYNQVVAAVLGYLAACVQDSPTLILAEDMHWFDEDSREVVQELLRAPLGRHVMVVMTSREHIVLPVESCAEVFELQPLTDSESDELIVTLRPDLPWRAQRAVRKRCDGIPLYIEEVVAKIGAQATDAATSAEAPDSLYEALFARLRSSTEAMLVVEAAAVLGNRVELNLLASAVQSDEGAVATVVDQLVAGRVLDPLADGGWRFRHELLREVAAELSPPTVRRLLHSRIADALVAASDTGNPDWSLIAHHQARAERFAEAATALERASRNAWQRGALREARNHLSQAIRQIAAGPPSSERDRQEILARLRRALLAQAAEGVASPNAAADFEHCLTMCSTDLQDDDLFSTVMSLYPYYTMRADLDRAERLVRSIRASLTGPRRDFLPINDFALGMLAWYRGDFRIARDKMDLAARTLSADATRQLDAMLFMPNDATAGLYTHRALSRYVDGDLTAAEGELSKAEKRCAELDFPQGAFSLAYSRQIEVIIRCEAGEIGQARAAATDLARLGEQHGFFSWSMVGAAQHETVEALAALNSDRHDVAAVRTHIATLTAFIDAWRAYGVISLITYYDAVLARLHLAVGAPRDAARCLEAGLAEAARTGMHFYDTELLRLRSCTHDDDAQRHGDLRAALELARAQGAAVFQLRAAVSAVEAGLPAGRDTLAATLEYFPEPCDWPELACARALLQ